MQEVHRIISLINEFENLPSTILLGDCHRIFFIKSAIEEDTVDDFLISGRSLQTEFRNYTHTKLKLGKKLRLSADLIKALGQNATQFYCARGISRGKSFLSFAAAKPTKLNFAWCSRPVTLVFSLFERGKSDARDKHGNRRDKIY